MTADQFIDTWQSYIKLNISYTQLDLHNLTDVKPTPEESLKGYEKNINFIKQNMTGDVVKDLIDFLNNKISESELKKKKISLDSILNWWKPKAILRYKKLFKPDILTKHVKKGNKDARNAY